MIEICNLTKKFGNKVAVNNLSLKIENGEICAFIGHNGAGKTTAIKCLVGILEPNEGKTLINGIDLSNDIEYKKQFAFIPDNPEVYDFMTAKEYFNFVADIYGISLEERNKYIEKYAKDLELEDVLNNTISSFSHGMKQKLVIISALLHSPKNLILDEPFVGLDPKATFTLKSIMKEFCKNGGSIFFSTHVLDVAEKLCDSVAIISNGELKIRTKIKNIASGKTLEELFLEIEK